VEFCGEYLKFRRGKNLLRHVSMIQFLALEDKIEKERGRPKKREVWVAKCPITLSLARTTRKKEKSVN